MSYTLSYGDYSFNYNPATLKIQKTRKIQLYNTPSKKIVSQELGFNPTIVTGEGYFVGLDAMEQYTNLYEALLEVPKANLSLPNLILEECYFTGLEIIFTGSDNSLRYRFEFTSTY